MSSVIFFIGVIGIVICLIGMLVQSQNITSINKDIRKLFYFYMGLSVAVCVASMSVGILWYIALGLVMFGSGVTMYIWKLHKEFARLKKLDSVNKFIEDNPDMFKEDINRINKLKIQLVELKLTIFSQSENMVEKAKKLKDSNNGT